MSKNQVGEIDKAIAKFNHPDHLAHLPLFSMFLWVGGPKGHKQIQPTREKIVLAFSMGNCKMNYERCFWF